MIIDKYPLYFYSRYGNTYELLYVVHQNHYSYFGDSGLPNSRLHRYSPSEFRMWVRDLFTQITPQILNQELKKRFEFPDEVLATIESLNTIQEEEEDNDDDDYS